LAGKIAAASKGAAKSASPETAAKKAVSKSAVKKASGKKSAAKKSAEQKNKKPAKRQDAEAGGEPRIGVFICHCGVNIAGFLDVPDVTEYARTLPNVVYTERNLYTCAEDGISAIKDAIVEHDLNRVVVASCTPRTHEPLFRAACEAAGLNKYLFEFANIRDQCSWVHMHD